MELIWPPFVAALCVIVSFIDRNRGPLVAQRELIALCDGFVAAVLRLQLIVCVVLGVVQGSHHGQSQRLGGWNLRKGCCRQSGQGPCRGWRLCLGRQLSVGVAASSHLARRGPLWKASGYVGSPNSL